MPLTNLSELLSQARQRKYCIAAFDVVNAEYAQAIVSAARRQLESHFPVGGPDAQIELLRAVPPVLVPAGTGAPQLNAALQGSAPPLGNVRVDVGIVRDGARLQKVPVSSLVRLYKQVAVARTGIARGESVTSENVTFARREVGSVRGASVDSPGELEMKVAARAILPGQIITRDMLCRPEQPVAIELNQRVFLVVETKTLRVVTVGKSLCRARRGEIASARNMSTGREVVGVAVGNSTIQVFLGGPSNGQ